MAWIEITDELQFYSLSDDMLMVLDWLWTFIVEMSPIYYTILLMALFIFMVIILLYRIDFFKNIGERK